MKDSLFDSVSKQSFCDNIKMGDFSVGLAAQSAQSFSLISESISAKCQKWGVNFENKNYSITFDNTLK